MQQKRETFGSRLGFILISAGCAIGLGNVWRFPYIAAQYGGAAFILIYLFFLLILGIPIMTMEFAVGRSSRKSIAKSFAVLEPKGSKWHAFGLIGALGNYLLMMFYTVVSGWLLYYFWQSLSGAFEPGAIDPLVAALPAAADGSAATAAGVIGGLFASMIADPGPQLVCMAIMIGLGFGICIIGLKKGVEAITKVMMIALIVIMLGLAVNSLFLEGADAGIRYYLVPDFGKVQAAGWNTVLFAAMGQAFFTLSVGIGSMAIFGSYIGRDKKLFGESITITCLDTFVAIMAGLIIIPACFAYNIEPNAGPPLIFITLPRLFYSMPGGRFWGTAFFLFMLFAALSTLVAVFENIISFAMDALGWSRRKSALVNTVLVFVLSLPALLGGNVWSAFQIPHIGDIIGLEDFIISQNVLPLGALVYVLFCTTRMGWGYDHFLAEANTGSGIAFPRFAAMRPFCQIAIPIIILYVFIMGYVSIFG